MIMLKKAKMNWMVNCAVQSFKDNNQSTISCSGKEALVNPVQNAKN